MSMDSSSVNGAIPLSKSVSSVNTSSEEYQKQLKKASEEFASIYVYEVFKKMYDTVPKSGFLQEGFGESWFREMLLQEYALKAARTDLKSVSDMIYKSLGGKELSEVYVDRTESMKVLDMLNTISSLGSLLNPLIPEDQKSGE
ncbi:MAG: rod-binding protein [Fervidobacterium sp.]|nr:rod-binding protein [Fervidobacterium sp.]HOQ39714.1 rod-binding protein [Fervidobacterium sp.]HPP18239.1 rod-binding protein [Fervidobacterium sp.]HPT53901.1 rod-binding protein [Fervidobacterium sp.]HRD19909.1 rod-binding protein [Fervidobacterium sp.]